MRKLGFAVAAAALMAVASGSALAQSTKTAVYVEEASLLQSTNSFSPIAEAVIHIAQQ